MIKTRSLRARFFMFADRLQDGVLGDATCCPVPVTLTKKGLSMCG